MDDAGNAYSPDPLLTAQGTARTTDPARAAALFEQSAAIMARLRAPGGCPWDREQNFDTIRKYTLEEVYEVFDAIERREVLRADLDPARQAFERLAADASARADLRAAARFVAHLIERVFAPAAQAVHAAAP